MTLVNTRAAFEKAVTDKVLDVDPTVTMVYDNVHFTTPGKTKKYILMSIDFNQSTLQNQGAASDYYAGVIQCNVYVPKSKGTSVLSKISASSCTNFVSERAEVVFDEAAIRIKSPNVNAKWLRSPCNKMLHQIRR